MIKAREKLVFSRRSDIEWEEERINSSRMASKNMAMVLMKIK
jgi:hypothetical protein